MQTAVNKESQKYNTAPCYEVLDPNTQSHGDKLCKQGPFSAVGLS